MNAPITQLCHLGIVSSPFGVGCFNADALDLGLQAPKGLDMEFFGFPLRMESFTLGAKLLELLLDLVKSFTGSAFSIF